MPVLLTLNEVQGQPVDTFSFEILMQKVGKITSEILKTSPMLVANTSSGAVSKEHLEREIIKTMDLLKLNQGIKRDELIESVFNNMFGYGPLQYLIDDESISDIDGTKFNEFSILRNGSPERVDINFGSEESFNRFCHLIAVRNYGILNENDPHCRICDDKNRLRINITIPPRNVMGSCINIRKHRRDSYTLKQLEEAGMLLPDCAVFLKECARSGVNIVFGGHGGSGKTTLLRALINSKPEMERLLICESDSEIFPDKPFCIVQRIKRSNEGGRIYTLGDLIKDGLTMRVETYVIGESVSSEAWEGLKAAHSGHGFLTTTHSMSGAECLERLVLLSNSGENSEREETICEVAGKAVDLVVYLRKFRVVEVLEVIGFNAKEKEFEFERLGKNGVFAPRETGRIHDKFQRAFTHQV
ncbi:MAG: ATPase, T2SS/T4P/T4SS family [Bacillota bacterium]